jgi:four helix bundle protein
MSHSYRDLLVWQKAKAFAVEIYQTTAKFPAVERFGLTSQLRRAAVSVPSNIAEGQGRMTRGEFQQFLGNARGSMLEVATLGLLNRLIESLQARPVLVKTT